MRVQQNILFVSYYVLLHITLISLTIAQKRPKNEGDNIYNNNIRRLTASAFCWTYISNVGHALKQLVEALCLQAGRSRFQFPMV
jgi:hypothetical protein